MKNILITISVSISFCIYNTLKEQVPPAYQASYSSMMKQNPFRNFQDLSMHMHLFNNGKIADTKFSFYIKFKDSTYAKVKSCLYYDSTLKRTYIERINKELPKRDSNRVTKIYPADVLSLDAGNELVLTGTVTDSCWLFKTLEGVISVYSIYPENYINTSIAAIQFNGGLIEAFDPEKLKQVIAGNERAIKQLNKKNYFQAIVKFDKANE